MDFDDKAARRRIVGTARSISSIAFAQALLPVSPAVLRIHQGGVPHISWAYSMNRLPGLLPTTVDKWAQESHEACVIASRGQNAWVSCPSGLALSIGNQKALAVWGVTVDVAQCIVAESAILVGLLTPEQVRTSLGSAYDSTIGERIRLQFDAVNAS